MVEVNAVLHTSGGGMWSDTQKDVLVTGITLGHFELMVYFDPKTWDVNEDGLIYTDQAFEEELQDMLTLMGLPGSDVCYSEQGMQGDDYVSCDVEEAFVESYKKKFADEYNATHDDDDD